MNPFRDRWQIVYEVLSADQDRAAQFAKDVITADSKGDLTLIDTTCANAQKLFGRAYLVNLKTGMVRPVRMFDDAPGETNRL